jgi:DNA-binding protein HU-beta
MATKPATAVRKKAAASAAPVKKPGARVTMRAAKSPAGSAARGAAQKKPKETVTLKAVFEQMAASHDLPKRQAHDLANEMVELLTMHLKNGDRMRMSGLGIIEVKDRAARTGRNPATGEVIQIAASKKVAFRAAKELKAAV